MDQNDLRSRLRVELETKQCNVSPETVEKMNTCIDGLRRVTMQFPVSDLFISVFHHPRNSHFHVKTSLVLMNTTLFTGDHDEHIYPAFERCIRKLIRKVETYTSELGNVAETRKTVKGTRQTVFPTAIPDAAGLEEAVRAGDYGAFRKALFPYEDPLRDRIIRRVNLHPEGAEHFGNGLTTDDILEEVYLTAFESYEGRRDAVRLGEWLEGLIDDAIHVLVNDPDEKENVEFARTLLATPKAG